MDIKFDHSFLSITVLHSLGIRSTVWLEEVLEDNNSRLYEISKPGDEFPVFFKVGFSHASIPILYVFEFNDKIISRQARKATTEEIRNFWCN